MRLLQFLRIGLMRPIQLTGYYLLVCTLWTIGSAKAQDPFVGEVACGGWNFCPAGWTECNGQLMPIVENEPLFSLIGTNFGGDGQSTFAVPNLASRVMVHTGTGPGLTNKVLGGQGGQETVTLNASQLPAHTHTVAAHSGSEKSASPTNKIPGTAPASAPIYGLAASANTALTATTTAGGSQAHNNLQPYLAVKCCIALTGIYPAQ